MKIVIISDLHANAEALKVLPEDFDYLLCAGDLVDYGPDPGPCINLTQTRAVLTVRGNHDQAAGYGVDCGCSYKLKDLSLATRQYMQQIMTAEETEYLRRLPLEGYIELGGCRFYLTHAVPGDMHYYLESQAPEKQLEQLTQNISADVIVWGHTHKPWLRRLNDRWLLNPGSLGQPRDGDPQASYAVWEDGRISLHRGEYPLGNTVKKIESGPLSQQDKLRLIKILRNGEVD